ncbi:MAG: replication initiator protein [Microviridae sp.]|nr:MAG: replication initiator protein [Microviridae sp.]
MCLYPKLLINRKYTATKKNGGIIPPLTDPRTLYVPVGCNKCIECKTQKARQWSVRLQEEIRTNKNAQFVTLTFSNEAIKDITDQIHLTTLDKNYEEVLISGYQLDNEIATYAVRRFLERWRKQYKTSVKHWLVTELGQPNAKYQGTENIHLHGFIWTDKPAEIKQKWAQYGRAWIGKYVNERTINYCIKYTTKVDFIHKEYNAKILASPGIGANYINRLDAQMNKYNNGDTRETYKLRNGQKINLPIYWRNKIYTEEEREKLWLQKLDKQIRWVCGEQIDISKGEQNYEGALKWYREMNNRLGYGNDEIDWDRKHYEEQRRKIAQETRIQKAGAMRETRPGYTLQ